MTANVASHSHVDFPFFSCLLCFYPIHRLCKKKVYLFHSSVYICMLQRERSGDGCDLASTFCKLI